MLFGSFQQRTFGNALGENPAGRNGRVKQKDKRTNMENEKVKIIMLLGPSSSGKTSIALILQKKLSTPFLYVPVDTFDSMLPKRFDEGGEFAWLNLQNKILTGYHYSEELSRREKARGDRQIGLAVQQYNHLPKQFEYDLIINTDDKTSEECAQEILFKYATTKHESIKKNALPSHRI